jgi:beta-glucosidase
MKAWAGRSRPRVMLCLAVSLLGSAATAAETWPRAAVHPQDAALDARVHAIVAGMTLEQKIGQITQADIRSITPDDVRK